MKRKKQKRSVGDIVSIQIGDNSYAYGWVLEEPLVAFFDYKCDVMSPDLSTVLNKPVAFRIWVMNHAITSGNWPILGNKTPPPHLLSAPVFYKQDSLTGKYYITYDGSEEIPSTAKDCENIEPAAVWEPEHVVDRLIDHFAGRANRWLETLRL